VTGGHLRWRFNTGTAVRACPPGLAMRTRSAVAVVAALPCFASAQRAQPRQRRCRCPLRRRHDAQPGMAPLTSPDCAPRARPGYPYARLPAKHPHGRREHYRPAHCRVPAWRKSARTSNYGCSSARPVSSRCPCRTAVAHAPGRCAAATICGVLRPCLGRRPPFVPPISTAAGQHGAGCPGASPAGL
jgi:hypothetical protein